jgi:hypothetical protein
MKSKYCKSITGVGRQCRGSSGKQRQGTRPKSDCRSTRKKKKKNDISFEVSTPVTVQDVVFSDVTLRSVEGGYQRFGGIICLHLQDRSTCGKMYIGQTSHSIEARAAEHYCHI